MSKKAQGFTLIEMMIVVAVVAIIAAIAFPSYIKIVRESNRSNATTDLMDIAQRLQRCFTTYGKFNPDGGKCSIYTQLKDNGPIVSRGEGYYEISISDDTATTYTLTATAVKAPQTGDVDGCNELTLDHRGVQLPEGCW